MAFPLQRADRVDRHVWIADRAIHAKPSGEDPAAFFRAEEAADQGNAPWQCVEEIGRHDRPGQRGWPGAKADPPAGRQSQGRVLRHCVGQIKVAAVIAERCDNAVETHARATQRIDQAIQRDCLQQLAQHRRVANHHVVDRRGPGHRRQPDTGRQVAVDRQASPVQPADRIQPAQEPAGVRRLHVEMPLASLGRQPQQE